MVDVDITDQLPHTPRKLGREGYRLAVRSVKSYKALAAWKAQAWLSSAALLGLIAALNWWSAFLVIAAWAMIAVIVYEEILQRGEPDFLEGSDDSLEGRINTSIRTVATGWESVAAKTYHNVNPKRGRIFAHIFALCFFGVLANHHHFRRSGFSQRETFWLNLLGRITNVLINVSIGAIIWHLAGPYISWFWSQVLWPVHESWELTRAYLTKPPGFG